MGNEQPTLQRCDDQIEWYDRRSKQNQRLYKATVVLRAGLAAVVALGAAFDLDRWVLAVLGVVLILLQTLESVGRWHDNWLNYRSTAEELKQEKYLWIAEAGPYADVDESDRLFAERIEALISREHTNWVASRLKAKEEHGRDTGA
ncbi:MAG: DUF4231 domain-containing protein [bacterium]|nr:DUF4231 domain-containing protein [bacterium]